MLKPLVFVVSAESHPDLLCRLALLFHRMAIPVHSLTMHPIDKQRTRLTVEVEARPELSERIAANLAKIIYVLTVTEDGRDGKPSLLPIRRRRPRSRVR
jgi:acetolactate synthase small subunit